MSSLRFKPSGVKPTLNAVNTQHPTLNALNTQHSTTFTPVLSVEWQSFGFRFFFCLAGSELSVECYKKKNTVLNLRAKP
jgi:hypothetical protein